MPLRTTRPGLAIASAGVLGLTIALTGCGGDKSSPSADTPDTDCSQFSKYGDLKGKTITVYTGIVTPEDTPYINSYKPFEKCTGAKVKYESDRAFETQVLVRAKAGNPPDI